MKKRYFIIFFSLIALITLMSSINPILPPIPFDYVNLNIPAFFNSTTSGIPEVDLWDNTPANDSITDDGATLGRVLFYDKTLSANGTVACGSCHLQEHSFSDTIAFSTGFNGMHTRRNSISLTNVRWFFGGKMFWDTRAPSLEVQTLLPFQDSIEMGNTLPQLIQTIQQQTYYPQLFENAFGDTAVTSIRISQALSQFLRSIVSHSSKYDIGRAQVSSPLIPFSNFTTSENEGKQLFFTSNASGGGDCLNCHKTEAFAGSNFGPISNGLDLVSTTDLGLYEATGNTNDIGKFKVPSLRNIALTAPYMHDGRFNTLEEVIDFYSIGIQLHMNLPPGLIDTINGTPVARQMNFTPTQAFALRDFLKTLTDTTIATEIKWSDPFALQTSATNTSTSIEDIQIFPNPASHYIKINGLGSFDSRIALVEIFNINNQKCFSRKIFLSSGDLIDISSLSDGMYLAQVTIGNQLKVKKFIKCSL